MAEPAPTRGGEEEPRIGTVDEPGPAWRSDV